MKKGFIIITVLLIFKSISFNQKKQSTCILETQMRQNGLVDVQSLDPSILVDLKYATTDNFVKKNMYDCLKKAFLQAAIAQKLKKASSILQAKNPNYRLLVYDAARPLSCQYKLWDALSYLPVKERETYVANPSKKSIHNYGCAIDLTIASADGKALDMGTKYDYFGKLAYPKYENEYLKTGKLSSVQISNRKLLREIMKASGFMSIEYEWWHFNGLSRKIASQKYPIIE
ncbi:MAG: M15 family metallopeptidase [Pseudarcicella sp.]|nr:M15 family metallopeptidase [Pseudarcicella sp.]MBP6409705.1 M15 family metallopeptidase [Pseudarcicella sp.]